MLNPKQALEIIKERANYSISLKTIYNWIGSGRLPAKRLGSIVLIDPADLDIFLADFSVTDKQSVGKAA